MSPIPAGPAALEGRDLYHNDGANPDLSGLAFTICKATQGLDIVDPLHTELVHQSQLRGLVTGSYHFLEQGDASAQCDKFLATTAPVAKAVHLYAVDVEMYNGQHPVPADLVAFHQRFHQQMPGRLLLVYSYASFWADVFGGFPLDCPHCRLWTSSVRPGIPQPGEVVEGYPQIYGGFPNLTLHQYTIAPTDRDRFYGTPFELAALASATTVAPTPDPTPAPNPGTAQEAEPMLIIRAKGRTAALLTPSPTGPLARYLSSPEWSSLYHRHVANPTAVLIEEGVSLVDHDALTGYKAPSLVKRALAKVTGRRAA